MPQPIERKLLNDCILDEPVIEMPQPIERNLLKSFMLNIAAELETHLNVPKEKIVSALETSKAFLNTYDFKIPLPRLNIIPSPSIIKSFEDNKKPSDLLSGLSLENKHLTMFVKKGEFSGKIIKEILSRDEKYGFSEIGKNKTLVVDFSSPNIAKPFHAGHLRSTVIGNFIINLYRSQGYKTVSLNYLGDWGKQFGLLGVAFAKYGNVEVLKTDPIKHLYDIYVKINKDAEIDEEVHKQGREYFARLEQGNTEEIKLWEQFRSLSIEELKRMYKIFNISFDVYSGESFYYKRSLDVVQDLIKREITVESDGAYIIDLDGLGRPLIQKKDGTSLYLTRDIACVQDRHNEYQFDKMIYVVSSQQSAYFKQLFKILEIMGKDYFKRCHHLEYGMVEGMSTRKGTVVFLNDIITEAKNEMFGIMKKNEEKFKQIENPEETALILGVSAIIVQDLKAKLIKNYEFKMDRMLSHEGTTGPYLQYSHARLCSIERKWGNSVNVNDVTPIVEEDLNRIIMHTSLYPNVLENLIRTNEPCHLVGYLMTLAQLISSVIDNYRVIDQEAAVATYRMCFYKASQITLRNGMRILGLTPLERM